MSSTVLESAIASKVEPIPIDGVRTPSDWAECVAEMHIASYAGVVYEPLPAVFEKYRSPDFPRQPWAGDHFWHMDLAREGTRVGELVTALYYAESGEHTPGTDFLDTVALRSAMDEDGELDEYDPSILNNASFVTTEGYFFSHTLPNHQLTHPEEAAAIDTFLSTLQLDGRPVDAYTYAKYLTSNYGRSYYPFLQPNPFSSNADPGFTFDAERGIGVFDVADKPILGLLNKLRDYIQSNEGMLRERGVMYTIQPEPGTAILFSREGTLHRALPGNNEPRRIFLAWLATKPHGLEIK